MEFLGIQRQTVRLWAAAEACLAAGVREVQVLNARPAVRPDRSAVAPHQHHIPTLVLCLRGAQRIITATGNIDLAEREAVAIAPGAWHAHAPIRPGAIAYGHGIMHGHADAELVDEAHTAVAHLPLEPTTGMLHAILDAAPDERGRLAGELLRQFITDGVQPRPCTSAQARMRTFLWMNLHRSATVAELLDYSGLSRRQAHRDFVAYLGETPKQALVHIRLLVAQRLLAEGASVTEAAARAGFRDRADLTRSWRRGMAGTPREAGRMV